MDIRIEYKDGSILMGKVTLALYDKEDSKVTLNTGNTSQSDKIVTTISTKLLDVVQFGNTIIYMSEEYKEKTIQF